MSTIAKKDWVAWHAEYQDPGSDLSRRLQVVQAEIRKALSLKPEGTFRAVSLCAGQGLDLLGVLSELEPVQRARIHARLVELTPDNVAAMRDRAEREHLDVEIVEGDAADTSLYKGAVPADLIVAVGIFGNISDGDIFRTIAALPQFAAPGATVVWSRGKRHADVTARIRDAFAEAGFVETAFHAPDGVRYQIGAGRYEGPAQALQPAQLFTFVH
jgi:hypothetical protein